MKVRKAQVQTGSAPGSSSPVHTSCAGLWDISSTWAWCWEKCHCCRKISCMALALKIHNPTDFNSYRPVALTSHLIKTLERLVLVHLHPLVSLFMDPLQFAFQPGIRVDDAIIFQLDRSLSHLEKPGSTVRIMFFDFCNLHFWGTNWSLQGWTNTSRPRSLTTPPTGHGMWGFGTVCRTQLSAGPTGTIYHLQLSGSTKLSACSDLESKMPLL